MQSHGRHGSPDQITTNTSLAKKLSPKILSPKTENLPSVAPPSMVPVSFLSTWISGFLSCDNTCTLTSPTTLADIKEYQERGVQEDYLAVCTIYHSRCLYDTAASDAVSPARGDSFITVERGRLPSGRLLVGRQISAIYRR